VTSGDYIQLAIAVVLTATLGGVMWYAWEARKQAKATWHIANASLRPLLEQWIEQTPLTEAKLAVWYKNVGNGPAINIHWKLEPAGQSRDRVSIGTQEVAGVVEFDLKGQQPEAVTAEYVDAHGSGWQSKLELTVRSGMIENGLSSHASR